MWGGPDRGLHSEGRSGAGAGGSSCCGRSGVRGLAQPKWSALGGVGGGEHELPIVGSGLPALLPGGTQHGKAQMGG